jgi:hypothetical protein
LLNAGIATPHEGLLRSSEEPERFLLRPFGPKLSGIAESGTTHPPAQDQWGCEVRSHVDLGPEQREMVVVVARARSASVGGRCVSRSQSRLVMRDTP